MAKVLIVDDHPLMREGLNELFAAETDLEVCGEADSAASALKAIELLGPDVVVLDLTLGADDGVSLVGTLRQRWPALPILVLSMHDEAVYGERLLAMGVRGYVMKQEASQVILTAVRKVLTGEHYVSAALAGRLYARMTRTRDAAQPTDALTQREREVLRQIARGQSTQDIAVALGMSAKTVDSHRRNMREKLGLGSAADLVRYAVQWASGDDAPGSQARPPNP
jgi:DNA-binding NarL/FixJ family response regulator